MRMLALILSFYLTVAITQIPFIQGLMPQSVQDMLALTVETEYEYLSIVVPGESFNPASVEYSEGLLPMEREQIERLLADIPGMKKINEDYYVYEGETITVDVSLYTGEFRNEVTEVEFSFPTSRSESIAEIVEVMLMLGDNIPSSYMFDYNHQTLYELNQADLLIRFYSEDLPTDILYEDSAPMGALSFLEWGNSHALVLNGNYCFYHSGCGSMVS